MRTIEGASPRVSAGNALFSLLGFMGMYMVLGILFLFVVAREIAQGPDAIRRYAAINAQPAAVEGGLR
jgi:cytochrome d ubiquinol oxidase subunit I